MIKVSVVIPVYNVEKYLEACMDSVLGQTLREIEVIAVDDASPDRCPEILDRYAAQDDRVTVIHLPENRRQGYGRNRGMEAARGEYIYFLDSDDMIAPEALQELYETAGADRLQAIFFDSEVIFDSEKLARRHASYPAVRQHEYPGDVISGQTLFDLFIRRGEWTCYVQRQFWDLAFLRREGVAFPDGVEHEDELFAFEGILLAERVRYIRKKYFIRRYREGSVMTTPPTAKNFHGYFMNFMKMTDFVRTHGIEHYGADQNIARMYQLFSRYYTELYGKEDLSGWFRPDEMQYLRFYDSLRQAEQRANELRGGLYEILTAFKHLYIYGAGVRGRQALRCIAAAGLAVDGFIVTGREGNPETVNGHRVTVYRDFSADKEQTIIVIGITKGYAVEVEEMLRADGWHCVRFLL